MNPSSCVPEPDAPAATVGVDVGNSALDAHADPSGAARQFANDRYGRRALRDWILRQGATRVALEPTGRYHRNLHQCLADAGLEVIVVNPRWTRNFARSIGREARNDLVDAAVLALYARLDLAPAAEPQPENERELADWVAARRALVTKRDDLRKSAAEFCDDAASILRAAIDCLQPRIQELDERIAARLQADPVLARRAEIIRSVPGCGPVTAAVLCAEMRELGSVSHAQAASLAGVAPFDCDSGLSRGAPCTWPPPPPSAGIRT